MLKQVGADEEEDEEDHPVSAKKAATWGISICLNDYKILVRVAKLIRRKIYTLLIEHGKTE